MATQTSLIAQQVRIRQWAEQIRACQNRPAGMEPVVHIQNTKGLSAEIFPGASPEIIRQLVEIFHHDE